MNKHFEDSLYYQKRAVEHAKLGVLETVRPVETEVRDRLGFEPKPEPTTVETVLDDVKAVERRATGEARDAIGSARSRFDAVRASN